MRRAAKTVTLAMGGRVRLRARSLEARKARLQRSALERLEDRTLMATLPPVSIANAPGKQTPVPPTFVDTSGTHNNDSSPQIAVDRYDPQKLVAVWVSNDPTDRPQVPQLVEGAYSTDGGNTWTQFPFSAPTLLDLNSSPQNPVPYADTTDPSVGFDSQNQVYVLVNEHSSGSASGAFVLTKFNFSSNAPFLEAFNLPGGAQNFNIVNQWGSGADLAIAPTLAVDDNQLSFTDPTTKRVQTDPFSNSVYVAWETSDIAPPSPFAPSNFNPNGVRFLSSDDGGTSFTDGVIANEFGSSYQHAGADRNAVPQLVVSQGNPSTGVPGGQVSMVWDDFGTLSQATPPQDAIMFSSDTTGGAANISKSLGGLIGAAQTVNNVAIPTTTSFPVEVDITDPLFTTVSSVAASMNIAGNNLNDLTATLEGPNGESILLFKRRGSLSTNPPTGIGGANMGMAPVGEFIGTTFDDNAARNIHFGSAPYLGHYTPEVGTMLGPFANDTPTALNGTWQLVITNFNTGAAPQLLNWTLDLSSGGKMNRPVQIATTPVRGVFQGNFALGVASTPNGVGPAPVIASDNTLGSFSPHEGNIYVAYVTRDTSVQSNPATNTDIALAVSSNGGKNWRVNTKVNDDDGASDGFSGAVEIPGTAVNGRTQYMPAITVDQKTGTLVMDWRDSRYDVQDATVATMVTTSIDGGTTFSKDVFANPPKTASDMIAGNTVVYGPQPDNESGGNSAVEATLGFGSKMGIAAYGGAIVPIWSGNLDRNNGNWNQGATLSVIAQPMVTAGGPRIISSTMGVVGQAGDTLNAGTGPDGTPKPNHIQVVFDREVDPSTFSPSDVEVFFKGTAPGSPFVPLLVTGVTPTQSDAFGSTQFLITFDPTKNADGSARTAPIDFTGTYSYLVKPSIADRIRSIALLQGPQPVINQQSGQINLPIGPGKTITQSSLDVNAPADATITGITVNLSIAYPRDGDLTLILTTPDGSQITLYQNPNDNGHDFSGTTFDSASGQSILSGSAPYSGIFAPFGSLDSDDGGPAAGTYSLTVKSSSNGTLTGTLLNWSITVHSAASAQTPSLTNGNLVDQNANAMTDQDVTVGPQVGIGDDYLVPRPTTNKTLNLSPGSGVLFPTGPYDSTTLPLMVPGPHVIATTVASPGYQVNSSDQLVLNSTVSSIDVHFDRDMDPTTVTPATVEQIMGPAGRIDAPQVFTLPGAFQNQAIPSGTGVPLMSTISVPNDNGTFPISHLAVALNIQVVQDQALTAFLIAPNGSKIQLFSGLSGSNLTNTVLDDASPNQLIFQQAPYTGTFKPVNSLQAFAQPNGKPMDLAPNTTQTDWTLEILNSKQGNVGKLLSWSLIATPQISITPNPNHNDPNGSDPRTYRINFPQQSLSGTYTVSLASTIASAAGDHLDSDLNAGLEVLKGGGSNSTTTPITYSAPGLPLAIPPSGSASGGQILSTITVPDGFTINDLLNPSTPAMTVTLNISGAPDPDLEATLVYHLGQSGQIIVPLFNFAGLSPVGNVGTNQIGFDNTVFNDKSLTPIQNGAAPFFGVTGPLGGFRSENPLLSKSFYTNAQGQTVETDGFNNQSVNGAWTLIVTNHGNSSVGKLNSWSMTFQKPLPSTGMGVPVIDDAHTSFRIFTMSPTNPLSSDTWTAVGPAAINSTGGTHGGAGGDSGRIGGIAVDPSDKSGNTVFIGGASGGVWVTHDFLNPAGPTWIPVTDFGPTFAINIGAIGIFPRNNDPRQSIVIAATGEGDTGSPGAGFLISMDGGASWNLYDSTVNTDSNGNLLPISSAARDHVFVGDSAFKLLVDPKLTPSGNVIIYAALSGPTGGIWRSQDTGRTWQQVLTGQATDLAYDLLSATGAPDGNVQVIYAGIRGQGVFMSPNQGTSWNLMAGGIGEPLLVNPLTRKNVNPTVNPSPNGAQGRIELAAPAPTGNTVQDLLYQEWLYAVVITPAGALQGLYLTKDFGQNWTQLRIPEVPPITGTGAPIVLADPINNINDPDYNIGGGPPGTGLPAQGNYDVSLGINQLNPNIVYLGGTADGQPSGFLRIDATNVWDSHNMTAFDANGIMGGNQNLTATNGALVLGDPTKGSPTPQINVIANANGYIGTQSIFNGGSTQNNGAGVTWIPFDIGGTDQHRIVTEVDPLTGLSRLIIGDDQGLFTGVDDNGVYKTEIGNTVLPTGSANGNLQITQFYYGASQPSNPAAQIAQALFYGSAQDNGGPFSDPNVLSNGNIVWGGAGGDASGVATDLTGSGSSYQYWWPCCGGADTEFFQVSANGGAVTGQTDGLLQQSNGLPTPDPQWPLVAGSNFTVNPIDGNQVAMSSQAGRIFRTETALQSTVNWFVIANPADLDSTYAPAVAFGAPDPASPVGIGNLDNFMYIGTSGGHIFVTETGGGKDGVIGTAWSNISLGLDGSTVNQIITDPLRGSHDAYAVTNNGVYYIADSIALAKNPTNTALEWQNITGNIFNIMYNSLGNAAYAATLAHSLDTIAADWRYTLPNTPGAVAGPGVPSHPVLYVGSNAGVYRSFDFGKTWALFPNITQDNAPTDGGYLPNVNVTSLSIADGNIDQNTGRAVNQAGDPNVLLASTYGRGFFAIKLAPEVIANTVGLSSTLPAPSGSNAGTAPNGGPLVTIPQPVFTGVSEQSAFGNRALVTLFNMTDPLHPVYIGGFDGTFGDSTDTAANATDAFGNFSVQVLANELTKNGPTTIGVQATDAAGTKGNIATFSFTLQLSGGSTQTSAPTPPTLSLAATSDSSHGQNVTNDTTPQFVGVTDPGVSVGLLDANGNVINLVDPNNPTGPSVTSVTSDPLTGTFSLQVANPLADNNYKVRAVASNTAGQSFSPFVTFTIKTTGPKTNSFTGLSAASDSGIVGDNVTTVRQPIFVGTTDANTSGDPSQNIQVQLLQIKGGTATVLTTVAAQANGSYSIQLPNNLTDGQITLETRVTDVSGNPGPLSSPIRVNIVGTVADYNLNSKTDPVLFSRTSASTGTWLIPGILPAAGTVFGTGGVVPFTGDFNADGVSDLAYYNLATHQWAIQDSSGTNVASGAISTIPLGQAGSIPVAGNFNANGGTEVGVYTPGTNGATSTWQIDDNVNGLMSFSFGQAGDIPVVGDFDAVGHDEIAVFRPNTGQFLVDNLANPSKPVTETFPVIGSNANLVPVAGDYDNITYFKNGKAEPKTEAAVFNTSTGLMTIAGPTGNYTVQFKAGDIPASGDYDALGELEPAVYRPSTNSFVVWNPVSKTFETTPVTPGAGSVVPVTAPYSFRTPLGTATTAPTISLLASDDSSHGLSITNVTKPHFVGTTNPNALVDLINATTGTVLATTTADASGHYSVSPTAPLTDGVYSLQTRAYGFNNDAGIKSAKLSVTIQTRLQVVSVSPSVNTYNSLPGGQIVVTFNHPLVGLTPNDLTGAGFSNNPFAVYLVPRGPSGVFSAPSGIDGGSTPMNATLIYNVDTATGTSSITLIPRAKLGTDVYLIAVSGSLKDQAGNSLLNASAQPGTFYSTFEIKTTTPNNTPLKITGVTTLRNSVSITNNATIPQPDTIAIFFNKPIDFLTADTKTVQLIDVATNTPVAADVAWSPTVNALYLTPTAALAPGVKYKISVAGSVSDDQGFPNPDKAFTLGSTFTRTFQVSGAGLGAGSSPFQVLTNAVVPGPGPRSAPFGYISIPLSESLDLSSVHRFSVKLSLAAGGLDSNNFDAGDSSINAQVSWNPNSRMLIVVPTVPLSNGTYLITINKLSASNGDTLSGVPIYVRFTLNAGGASASVSRASRTSHELVTNNPALTAGTAPPMGAAVIDALANTHTNETSSTTTTAVTVPAQSTNGNHLFGGLRFRPFFHTRRGQSLLANLERLAAERAHGD
jgi:subtilisin-like proprotein convertase family protein